MLCPGSGIRYCAELDGRAALEGQPRRESDSCCWSGGPEAGGHMTTALFSSGQSRQTRSLAQDGKQSLQVSEIDPKRSADEGPLPGPRTGGVIPSELTPSRNTPRWRERRGIALWKHSETKDAKEYGSNLAAPFRIPQRRARHMASDPWMSIAAPGPSPLTAIIGRRSRRDYMIGQSGPSCELRQPCVSKLACFITIK